MKIWQPVALIGQFLECQSSLGFCVTLSINCMELEAEMPLAACKDDIDPLHQKWEQF